LGPTPECHTTVGDPARSLAALRARFPDERLARAGVLARTPGGQYCLSPELTDPQGALIALRDHPKRTPMLLLGAQGCVPRRHCPVTVVRKDGWTAEKVMRGGVLFATPRIQEVALLRHLGFAATLAIGISQLSLDGLRELDAMFGVGDLMTLDRPSGNVRETAQASAASGGAWPIRPTLVLLGCSLLRPAAQPSPALLPAVAHLAMARRHLGLVFSGVMAWQFRTRDLDNLRYRLTFRNAQLVQELLQASADSPIDFECLDQGDGHSTPAPPQAGYVAAQADLLTALGDDRDTVRPSHRVRQARAVYDEMVQRELIAPLQGWALSHGDPIIRGAGVELANICRLLHRMSPLLTDLLDSRCKRAQDNDTEPIPPRVFGQYLALTARFGGLLRDLSQWRQTWAG
jgi:hypothetical protein